MCLTKSSGRSKSSNSICLFSRTWYGMYDLDIVTLRSPWTSLRAFPLLAMSISSDSPRTYSAPSGSITHHQDPQITTTQRLTDVQIWSMRVYTAPLVKQIFHGFVTRQDYHGLCAEYQAIHGTILPRPLFELQMCISSRHLEDRSVSKHNSAKVNLLDANYQ
jgi:hypothetical protein